MSGDAAGDPSRTNRPEFELIASDEEAMAFVEEMTAEIMREIDEAEERAGAPYPFWKGGEDDVRRWKAGLWP